MNYSSLFNSTDYSTNDISCENLTVSSTLVNAGTLTQSNVATFSDAVSFLSTVSGFIASSSDVSFTYTALTKTFTITINDHTINPNKIVEVTTGQMIQTNGSNVVWNTMSGDATINSSGVITVSKALQIYINGDSGNSFNPLPFFKVATDGYKSLIYDPQSHLVFNPNSNELRLTAGSTGASLHLHGGATFAFDATGTISGLLTTTGITNSTTPIINNSTLTQVGTSSFTGQASISAGDWNTDFPSLILGWIAFA